MSEIQSRKTSKKASIQQRMLFKYLKNVDSTLIKSTGVDDHDTLLAKKNDHNNLMKLGGEKANYKRS